MQCMRPCFCRRLSARSYLFVFLHYDLHLDTLNFTNMKAVVVVIIVSILVAAAALFVANFYAPTDPPEMKDEFWGRGVKTDDPREIKEVEITPISDDSLKDLDERLAKTHFFENLEGVEWEYGTNPDYVRALVDHWRTKFDWRNTESIINSFKHYNTIVHGLNIHFIHHRPTLKDGQRAVPIILLHGWPGSFYEFHKVIPKFIEASTDEYAFEIICPSLPGYGFSEAPRKQGFSPLAAARVFVNLMAKLGFKSYYAQGGHWGSLIASCMARLDPRYSDLFSVLTFFC